MRYLLDSNACIALLNNTSPSLLTRVRRHRPSDIGLPALVTHELYYGAFKSRRTSHNLELVDRIAFEVIPFDASDAREAGAIRADLEAIGPPDRPIRFADRRAGPRPWADPGDRQQPGVPAGEGPRLRRLVSRPPPLARSRQAARHLVQSAMGDGGPMSSRPRVQQDSGWCHNGTGTAARLAGGILSVLAIPAWNPRQTEATCRCRAHST